MIDAPRLRVALAAYALLCVALPTRALAFDKELDAVIAVLEQRSAPESTRLDAARKLVELKGEKAAGRLLDVALEKTSSYELQTGLAEVLAGVDDDKTQGALLKVARDRRADVASRLFALRALRAPSDPKALHALCDLFEDEDAVVRQAALDAVVALRLAGAVPELRELLRTRDDEDMLRPAGGAWLDALAALDGARDGFADDLVAYADDPRLSVRTAALRLLASRTDPDDARLPALLARALARDDWQDVSAGVALARVLPPLVAIDALLAEFGHQTGRLHAEFDAALRALSGQDFGGDPERWTRWWTSGGRQALLAPADDEREPWKRRPSTLDAHGSVVAATPPRFFDVEVNSHDIVFVVDISGSMMWPASLVGEPVGGQPPPDPDGGASRIDVAREQLHAAISGLDEAARFNIVAFNDRARPWIAKGGMAEFGKAGKRASDALRFVDSLSPTDGTNLYGALQLAFQDPSVDTIYLLTDGVPSLGDVTVPELIRRSVDAWNAQRHVVLNAIAMGLDEEKFPLLRELAEDNGGTFVMLP
ncbi:MAG: HEAT repeat domain-containing protein [Planctomycetes bacterium]|nr:HEAT repeat domain-containing protein [Planctomycetota bacterium]